MLIFCDESWKEDDQKQKVGTLAAIAIPRKDYNDFEDRVFHVAEKYLGAECARNGELKGKHLLSPYEFRRIAASQTSNSLKLNCARELLEEMRFRKFQAFAVVVQTKSEVELLCEDGESLDRPYAFLMERVNSYVSEKANVHASFCFDDRGIGRNAQVGTAFRNFLARSKQGRSFRRILRTPTFAFSHLSAGIQMADLLCTVVNRFHADVKHNPAIRGFYTIAKSLEWVSAVNPDTGYPTRGFKSIKTEKKERRPAAVAGEGLEGPRSASLPQGTSPDGKVSQAGDAERPPSQRP